MKSVERNHTKSQINTTLDLEMDKDKRCEQRFTFLLYVDVDELYIYLKAT